jgi:hypothetical protein
MSARPRPDARVNPANRRRGPHRATLLRLLAARSECLRGLRFLGFPRSWIPERLSRVAQLLLRGSFGSGRSHLPVSSHGAYTVSRLCILIGLMSGQFATCLTPSFPPERDSGGTMGATTTWTTLIAGKQEEVFGVLSDITGTTSGPVRVSVQEAHGRTDRRWDRVRDARVAAGSGKGLREPRHHHRVRTRQAIRLRRQGHPRPGAPSDFVLNPTEGSTRVERTMTMPKPNDLQGVLWPLIFPTLVKPRHPEEPEPVQGRGGETVVVASFIRAGNLAGQPAPMPACSHRRRIPWSAAWS